MNPQTYNKHLTFADRLQIEALTKAKHTKTEIARILDRPYETIRRELRRGACTLRDGKTWEEYTGYSARVAQDDYDSRAQTKGRPIKLEKDYVFSSFVESYIKEKNYSVDAVLYEAENRGFQTRVSRTTLYRYIDMGIFLTVDNKDLPYGKRPKHEHHQKPVSLKQYRSIEQRDISRDDFGHWEMDTVIGKAKADPGCLLVLTERKTRQEINIKMSAKTADCTVLALNDLCTRFEGAFSKVFKTITMDNGSEFQDAANIEYYQGEQRTTVYYCHPYSSYERGSNENSNRLVRRRIPKGTPMSEVTPERAKACQDWINNYPRGILGGKTSNQCFFEELQKMGINDLSPFYTFFS